ncbi:MAG: hypothetical protein ACRDO1_11670 [Nocardioidaceae bacterium]
MLLIAILVVSMTGLMTAFAFLTMMSGQQQERGSPWLTKGLPAAALLVNGGLLIVATRLDEQRAALLLLGGMGFAAASARALRAGRRKGR